MTNQELDQLTHQFEEQVAKLSQHEQLLFLERIISLIRSQAEPVDDTGEDADEFWTDEDLAELLKPKKGLTGKEIIEKHTASGAIGSWADMGIEDGAEWVNQQKAVRKADRKQKLGW